MKKQHFNFKEVPEEIWERAEQFYFEHKSVTLLINTFKYPGLTFSKFTKRLRDKGIIIKNYQNDRSTNHKAFSKIDTEEKAYWLGFLYADGNVSSTCNSIELSLHQQDFETLEKFKKFIKGDNKYHFCKKWKVIRYAFCSKKVKEDLINLGCVPKKSLILKFPTEKQVPNHLIHHFIRGYFDGDGCISKATRDKNLTFKSAVSVMSTEHFLNGIVKSLNINTKQVFQKAARCSEKTVELKLCFNLGIDFLNKIYSNSTIHLRRKYIRYRIFKMFDFKLESTNKFLNLFTNCYKK